MQAAILEALAGTLGGAQAQANMMGETRRSLLSQPEEDKDAKIKQAISLLSEAIADDTRQD